MRSHLGGADKTNAHSMSHRVETCLCNRTQTEWEDMFPVGLLLHTPRVAPLLLLDLESFQGWFSAEKQEQDTLG